MEVTHSIVFNFAKDLKRSNPKRKN